MALLPSTHRNSAESTTAIRQAHRRDGGLRAIMAAVSRKLADGVYEHLITDELDRGLAQLDTQVQRAIEGLADADGHLTLARHLGQEVARVLGSIPIKERVEAGRQLVSKLIGELTTVPGIDRVAVQDQQIPAPARRLLAIHRGVAPERPATPLAISTLLTRNKAEPSLGHELASEIAIADRIDAVVAFVTVSGVRAIREALEGFALRGDGQRLRLLTTTFTGTTEIEALDQLASLPGVQVKVSYDVRRTRLHAKAWLFHRESGLTTAYVGSANLTATALTGGQEWMVKLCAADLPHVIEKFEGTFETLWQDPEFEGYDPRNDEHRIRLRAALGAEQNSGSETALTLLSLRPYPFQEEILDRLAAERAVHNRRRNLIIAATGTGKTVIAAFDYARVAETAGVRPRLLFLAHRYEILAQARDTFRHVLHDAAFGELLTGSNDAQQFDHVFATIQKAADLLERFGRGHFRHVIVDECHHVPAASYQAVVPLVTPDLLVGLTATPERSDGKSLLPDFDGHIGAELRLWHALDRQLLVPFEYYGLSDGVDLRHVQWTRHGYNTTALADVYTGHHARAALVLHQLSRRVGAVRQVRALGFCVSIDHAEFMAAQFTAAGVPSLAVHGGSPEDVRIDAPRRLRQREVNVLFTCDLYNEGVDLPFVDTLLLLRPTMSATLFMQQLGRGLRHHPKKASCLVLDFIGQHHEEFRFDAVLSALTGAPRVRLRTAVAEGFPFLPSGCTLQLDAVARETVLHSLRTTLAGAQRLAAELRDLAATGPVSLRQFLDETGRELEDVYGHNYGWTTLRRMAGLQPADEETEDLSRRLGWLTHVDEPSRLRAYRDMLAAAASAQPFAPSDADRVRMHMLEFQLSHRGVMPTAEASAQYLAARPAIVDEMEQLREVLEDRTAFAAEVYPVDEWPLALHRHYRRREILAAVGFVKPGERGVTPQSGLLQLKETRRELLFVTLDKSGRGFSPTTRYRDFAISPQTFHWETQGVASVSRPSGRRYIESAENGWSFFLFVRTDPEAAYAFLGQVRYEAHAGDRPIAITWRLEHPMPAGLFESYATLAAY
jgi:superfamily II DNA or RNA helicase/HKD family nuclease